MTIDERLDRLTGRHEALTETVQSMSVEGQRLLRSVTKLERTVTKLERSTTKLAETAENHERRLSRIEKRGR